jgi:hypothetical protein
MNLRCMLRSIVILNQTHMARDFLINCVETWAGRFATIDKMGGVVTQSTACSNN